MNIPTDWLKVFFNTVIFTIGLLIWAYLRRKMQHAPRLSGTIPRTKRVGIYAMTALLGLDFGLLSTFGVRLLHGNLLIVLVAANVILGTVIFGFGLLRPLQGRQRG